MTRCRQRSHKRVSRRGFTLIEMVAVFTAGAILLGVAVTTIHLILRTHRNVEKGALYGLSRSRLAELIPQDVHAATSAEVTPGESARPARLDLTFPAGKSVRYEVDRNSLVRVERVGEKDRHRDVFHVPVASTIRFERERNPDLVRVIVERPAGLLPSEPPAAQQNSKGESPAGAGNDQLREAMRTISFEALLSRDHRFESVSGEKRP